MTIEPPVDSATHDTSMNQASAGSTTQHPLASGAAPHPRVAA